MNYDEIFEKLELWDSKRLRKLAKKLEVSEIIGLNNEELIKKIISDQGINKLTKILKLTWWDKNKDTIYGISSILGLAITIYTLYPLFNAGPEIFIREPIFAKNDTLNFKVLVSKFRTATDVDGFKTDVETEIYQRLDSMINEGNLNMKVSFLDSAPSPKVQLEAFNLAKNNNADMIIWGSSIEKFDKNSKTLDRLKIRYTLTKGYKIGSKRLKGNSGYQKFSTLDQLRLNGYLQSDIDYIIRWVSGMMEYYSGNFKSAIDIFNKINEIEYSNNEIEILERIGDIYRQLGESEKALLFHKKANKNINNQSKTNKTELYLNNTYMSLAFFNLGKIDSAYNYLQLIDKEILYHKTQDTSSFHFLSNISLIFTKLGKYNESLDIQEKIISNSLFKNQEILQIAALYNNMAINYMFTNNLSKSTHYFTQTKNILLSQNVDSVDTKIGILEANIGELKKQQCKYIEALEYSKRARRILELTLDSNHINLAAIKNNIAAIYYELNEYNQAYEYYNLALKIYQNNEIRNTDYGMLLSNFSTCLFRMEKDSLAFQLSTEGIEILEEITGREDHPHLAIAYNNHANALYQLNNKLSAVDYIDKAINMASTNNYSQNLVILLANSAKIHNNFDRKKAKKLKKQAYDEFIKSFPIDHCMLKKLKEITKEI